MVFDKNHKMFVNKMEYSNFLEKTNKKKMYFEGEKIIWEKIS